MAQFPDVPAIVEALPGDAFRVRVDAFVPNGSPQAIASTRNADSKVALSAPHAASRLTKLMFDPLSPPPAQCDGL